MAVIAQRENMVLVGKCILRAYPAGELEEHLFQGLTLSEAQDVMYLKGQRQVEIIAKNLVVNDGLEIAIDMLIDAENDGLVYCEIGTSAQAPASGDADLVAGVSRKAWLTRTRAAQTGEFSTFFLAAESTYAIEEVGNFGGTGATITVGSGKIYARWLQSYDNSLGNNDLTIDYSITAEAG